MAKSNFTGLLRLFSSQKTINRCTIVRRNFTDGKKIPFSGCQTFFRSSMARKLFTVLLRAQYLLHVLHGQKKNFRGLLWPDDLSHIFHCQHTINRSMAKEDLLKKEDLSLADLLWPKCSDSSYITSMDKCILTGLRWDG